MVNRCILFLAIAALAAVPFCHAKDDDKAASELMKNFQKINDYLEKNEPSGDPELNMAKVEEMLDEKSSHCTLLGGSSLVKALKMLSQLANVKSEKELCDSAGISLIERLDAGLYDPDRNYARDYHPSRVERIVEHYAYQNTLHCNFMPAKMPKVGQIFSRHEYRDIDQYLARNLPEDINPAAGMEKAEELLSSLESRTGTLAKALEQFLQLRDTLNKDTCNWRGFEILHKNDLAMWGAAHSFFSMTSSPIAKIFFFYAKEHAAICHYSLWELAQEKLKSLHEDTYRNVLGLVSLKFVDGPDVERLAAEVKQKKVDGDFTVSHAVKYLKLRAEKSELCPSLSSFVSVHPHNLYLLLKAASADDSDSRYLIVDEIAGTQQADEGKLRGAADKYIFKPCDDYMSTFGDLKLVVDYSRNMNGPDFPRTEGRFMDDLAFQLALEAYNACNYLKSNKDYLIGRFQESAKSV